MQVDREWLVMIAFRVGAGLVALIGLVLAASVLFAGEQLRLDTFDKYGNRTGYSILDPKSGRVDSFDVYSRRLGSGQISTPPALPPSSAPLFPPPSAPQGGPGSPAPK